MNDLNLRHVERIGDSRPTGEGVVPTFPTNNRHASYEILSHEMPLKRGPSKLRDVYGITGWVSNRSPATLTTGKPQD